MNGRNQVSDKDLQKLVNQRLMRAGIGSQSRVAATVNGGTITITGNIQYAIQRSPIVKALSNIPGIRRVLDQLQLVERSRQQ